MSDATDFKAWRTARGFGQEEAATFCGISRRQVIKIEAGDAGIKQDVRDRMDSPLAATAAIPPNPPRKVNSNKGRPQNVAPAVKPGERATFKPIKRMSITLPNGDHFEAPSADPLERRFKDLDVSPRLDVPPDDKAPEYLGQLHPRLPAPRDIGPAVRAVMYDMTLSIEQKIASRAIIRRVELERLASVEVHPDGFVVPIKCLGLNAKGRPCLSRTIYDPPTPSGNGGFVSEMRVFRSRSGEGSSSVQLVGTPGKGMTSQEGFHPLFPGNYNPAKFSGAFLPPNLKPGEAKRRQSESARI